MNAAKLPFQLPKRALVLFHLPEEIFVFDARHIQHAGAPSTILSRSFLSRATVRGASFNHTWRDSKTHAQRDSTASLLFHQVINTEKRRQPPC
jgi:hypothetical protein